MSEMGSIGPRTKRWLGWAVLMVAVIVAAVLGVHYPLPTPPLLEPQGLRLSQFDSVRVQHRLEVGEAAVVEAPTAMPTATPAMRVNQVGVGRILQIEDASTPVAYINDGGTWGATGAGTLSGALDMSANVISNVGNAGTDFGSNGGLTLAQGLTVSAGGVTVSAGGLGVSGMLSMTCTYHTTATTEQNLTPANSCYVVAAANAITFTLQTTGMVTGTLLTIANLSSNNVIVADSNIRTSTGAAITMGQYDVSQWLFTGTEWYELLLIADS